MVEINKLKPVLVTGATGYVAGWIIKQLLEEGIIVHAAVRNPDDKNKRAHLDKIAEKTNGTIRYFKSDLLTEGSYLEAMKDCELIFHTASPFTVNVKDPQKELIDPAVKGTENVLLAANKTPTVKRIVLTSSCAAIYTDANECQIAPNGILTENVWNTTASLTYQPYAYSKVLAEKKAWAIAEKQFQWDLITINPALVLGPMLNPKNTTSESLNILKPFGDGSMKAGVPKLGTGVVDVRDVAKAHILAGFTPSAKGRYITMGHNTDFLEMSLALQPKYGSAYPIPKKALPKWLLIIVGPIANKLFTRQVIRNNVNVKFKADNSKIKRELKMDFLPLKTTMEDSFQVLVDERIIKSKT